MNTIVEITIENFQAHLKTKVTVAPNGQLTVLTGPSDAGKTATIRALRWVLYNIPQGTDFIRHGASFARVTVEYASGHKVIRERSRSSYNRYKIIVPGIDKPEVYEGFGNNVPLEVQQVTGVVPVTIGDMEFNLNISEQLDGPFLGKSVSSGARAKVLGKLAGTEEVDYANKTIGTDLHRKRQEEKSLEKELQDLSDKIKAYNYLDDLGKNITELKAAFDQLKNDMVLMERLRQLSCELQEVNKHADEKLRIITALRHRLEQLTLMIAEIESDLVTRDKLYRLVDDYEQANIKIQHCFTILSQTAGIDKASALIKQTQKDWDSLNTLSNLIDRILYAYTAAQKAKKSIEATNDNDLIADLIQATEELFNRNQQLNQLAAKLSIANKYFTQSETVLKSTMMLPTLTKLVKQVEQDHNKYVQLHMLAAKIVKNNTNLSQAAKILQQTGNAEQLLDLIHDTKQAVIQRTRLQNYYVDLDQVTRGAEYSKQKTQETAGKIQEAEQRYIKLLTSLGVCPTCGSKIKPEKLKEVI